jgi:hypothetical protein
MGRPGCLRSGPPLKWPPEITEPLRVRWMELPAGCSSGTGGKAAEHKSAGPISYERGTFLSTDRNFVLREIR